HGALTFSMMYASSEKFFLALSHDEVVHGKCSLLNKMPGSETDKFANLRVAYGFMAGHPGKKLLFMGQDFGQKREWSEERSLDWFLLEDPLHAKLLKYMEELLKLYRKYPCMYVKDFEPDGFEWMSCEDADHSTVSFVRRGNEGDKELLFICNFTPVRYEGRPMGVPFAGTYKEIFNSDSEEFGGTGFTNPKAIKSKPIQIDGRPNSMPVNIPPLGMAVFTCTSDEEKKAAKAKDTKAEAGEKPVKAKTGTKKAPAGKTAASKKTAVKKTAKES
ncbi:MAG: alpha amylase C-terminal domain-containing protein, partial [Lachnospiraceae bacterium]|nr:alpha amylase C-terminal domain-containing protein [Lachnospiraceae bacterium]